MGGKRKPSKYQPTHRLGMREDLIGQFDEQTRVQSASERLLVFRGRTTVSRWGNATKVARIFAATNRWNCLARLKPSSQTQALQLLLRVERTH